MPVSSKGKKRILVIDDDQEVRSLFVRTLEPKGFDVVTSADPDEGVNGARETVPDIIFISLLFQHSNGLKVSKAIHADEGLHGVPIVMLTSYKGELDPKYTATIGVVDVLVKPIAAQDILAKTVSLLGAGLSIRESDEGVSIVPAEEEKGAYSIERAFEDLEKESPAVKEESPWDREFSDLEEEVPAAPAGGEKEKPVRRAAGRSEKDEFLDFEMEEEVPGGKGGTASGEQKADEGGEGRHREDDYIPEEVFIPEPKKSPVRRILTVLGVAILVAGAGIGAFRLVSFFSHESGRSVKKEVVKKVVPPTPEKPKEPPTVAEPAKPVQPQSAAPVTAETAQPSPPVAAGKRGKVTGPAQTARKAVETPPKEEVRARQPETKSAPMFSVQVGFFKEGKNASRLVEKLKGKGYDAYVLEETGATRVLIGKFSDRRKASEEARLISRKEGLKSIVYHTAE